MSDKNLNYRIKMTVAVYRNKKLVYRNELVLPGQFEKRSETRIQIKKEINERLRNSNFFISPRVDFDLVRYTQEASCNTYLRYRIVEEKSLTPGIQSGSSVDIEELADLQ
ncbi:MAG: hypothetical protein OEZ34_13365 [Spirochaetia bacterium]|nr:hypothetical protein [Spirochaetia bacterium]